MQAGQPVVVQKAACASHAVGKVLVSHIIVVDAIYLADAVELQQVLDLAPGLPRPVATLGRTDLLNQFGYPIPGTFVFRGSTGVIRITPVLRHVSQSAGRDHRRSFSWRVLP